MKKTILSIALLLVVNFSFAQNFNAAAYYSTSGVTLSVDRESVLHDDFNIKIGVGVQSINSDYAYIALPVSIIRYFGNAFIESGNAPMIISSVNMKSDKPTEFNVSSYFGLGFRQKISNNTSFFITSRYSHNWFYVANEKYFSNVYFGAGLTFRFKIDQ